LKNKFYLLFFILVWGAGIFAQTSISSQIYSNKNLEKIEYFSEGNFLIHYGVGYTAISRFLYNIYGLRDLYSAGDSLSHAFVLMANVDYFFRKYFIIGFEFLIIPSLQGQTIKLSQQSLQGTLYTLSIALKIRTLIHFPIKKFDIYGGFSSGFFYLGQYLKLNDEIFFKTLSPQYVFGWSFLLGIKFVINVNSGLFFESNFPLNWFALGGYYSFRYKLF
jgi:hypothetical protein